MELGDGRNFDDEVARVNVPVRKAKGKKTPAAKAMGKRSASAAALYKTPAVSEISAYDVGVFPGDGRNSVHTGLLTGTMSQDYRRRANVARGAAARAATSIAQYQDSIRDLPGEALVQRVERSYMLSPLIKQTFGASNAVPVQRKREATSAAGDAKTPSKYPRRLQPLSGKKAPMVPLASDQATATSAKPPMPEELLDRPESSLTAQTRYFFPGATDGGEASASTGAPASTAQPKAAKEAMWDVTEDDITEDVAPEAFVHESTESDLPPLEPNRALKAAQVAAQQRMWAVSEPEKVATDALGLPPRASTSLGAVRKPGSMMTPARGRTPIHATRARTTTPLKNQPSVDPDDEAAAEETGLLDENPVAYFVQMREQGVPFVYLNRWKDPKGLLYNPYKLVVVPLNMIDAEYYTMSANGVTFVGRDGASEFTPMSTWVRETNAFNTISRLSLFRKYRYWKTFNIWRKYIRQRRYKATKAQLDQATFTLLPKFRSCLVDVVEACLKMQNIELMKIKLHAAYAPAEFADAQVQQRRHVKERMGEFSETVTKRVELMCQAVCDPERTRVEDDILAPTRKKISLRQILQMEKEKAAERARLTEKVNAEIRLIGRLVRLVTYVSLEHLVELVLSDFSDFLGALKIDKATLFRAEVVFNDQEQVDFVPNLTATSYLVKESLAHAVDQLGTLPVVLHHPPFRKFLWLAGMDARVLAAQGPALRPFLSGVERYSQIEQSIITLLERSYIDAGQYARVFDQFRVIHHFNTQWRPTIYRQQRERERETHMKEAFDVARAVEKETAGTVFGGMTVSMSHSDSQHDRAPGSPGPTGITEDDPDKYKGELVAFAVDLLRFKRWTHDLERMQTVATRGVLLIDAKALKSALIPIPERATKDMKQLLAQMSSENINKLSEAMRAHMKLLAREPGDLDEFCTYMQLTNQMPDDILKTKEELKHIDAAYDLLESARVTLSYNDQQAHSLVHATFNRFQESVTSSQGRVERHLPGYSKSLDLTVTSMHESLKLVLQRLESPEFVPATIDDASPQGLLAELAEIRRGLESASRAVKLEEYQGIFGVEQNANKLPMQVTNALDHADQVWRLVGGWRVLLETYDQQAFHTLGEQFANKVERVAEDVKNLREQWPESPVVQQLSESVERYHQALPALADISSAHMQPRHWARLFSSIKKPYDASRLTTLTLPQLLEYGIFDYPDLVIDVAAAAAGEHALEQTLSEVRHAWKEAMLDLSPLSVQRPDVYVLRNAEQHAATFEEHEVKLGNMLGSEYIIGIRQDFEHAMEQLGMMTEALSEWVQGQEKWRRLDAIFAQDDAGRRFPSHNGKWRVVNRKWAELTRRARKDPNVIAALLAPGTIATLKEAHVTMARLLASMNEWVDERRQAFPRLYFLADDEVYDLCSHINDPAAVARGPYLRKMFAAVSRFLLRKSKSPSITASHASLKPSQSSASNGPAGVDAGAALQTEGSEGVVTTAGLLGTAITEEVLAVTGAEGETISFNQAAGIGSRSVVASRGGLMSVSTDAWMQDDEDDEGGAPGQERVRVYTEGPVDGWIRNVDSTLRQTMRVLMDKCLMHAESVTTENTTALTQWIMLFPGQIAVAAWHIVWTQRMEEALDVRLSDSKALSALANMYEDFVSTLTGTITANRLRMKLGSGPSSKSSVPTTGEDVPKGGDDGSERDDQDSENTSQVSEESDEPGLTREEAMLLGPSASQAAIWVRRTSSVFLARAEALLALTIELASRTSQLAQSGSVREKGRMSAAWQLTLRAHYDSENSAVLYRHGPAVLPYGFEYIGLTPRLFINSLGTPADLEDGAGRVPPPTPVRAPGGGLSVSAESIDLNASSSNPSLAVFTALHGGWGAMLSGDPGAGKSGLVHDLASTLGRHLVSFQCSPLNVPDVHVLERIVTGAAASGAWLLFEDMDAQPVGSLAAIGHVVATILRALRDGQTHIEGDGGRMVPLDPEFGFLATLRTGLAHHPSGLSTQHSGPAAGHCAVLPGLGLAGAPSPEAVGMSRPVAPTWRDLHPPASVLANRGITQLGVNTVASGAALPRSIRESFRPISMVPTGVLATTPESCAASTALINHSLRECLIHPSVAEEAAPKLLHFISRLAPRMSRSASAVIITSGARILNPILNRVRSFKLSGVMSDLGEANGDDQVVMGDMEVDQPAIEPDMGIIIHATAMFAATLVREGSDMHVWQAALLEAFGPLPAVVESCPALRPGVGDDDSGSGGEMEVEKQAVLAMIPQELGYTNDTLAEMMDDWIWAECERTLLRDAVLAEVVEEEFSYAGLQPDARFIAKALQLHEALVYRPAVALVGGACGGKTSCRTVLANALTRLANQSAAKAKALMRGSAVATPTSTKRTTFAPGSGGGMSKSPSIFEGEGVDVGAFWGPIRTSVVHWAAMSDEALFGGYQAEVIEEIDLRQESSLRGFRASIGMSVLHAQASAAGMMKDSLIAAAAAQTATNLADGRPVLRDSPGAGAGAVTDTPIQWRDGLITRLLREAGATGGSPATVSSSSPWKGRSGLPSADATSGTVASMLADGASPPGHHWIVLDGPAEASRLDMLGTLVDPTARPPTLCHTDGSRSFMDQNSKRVLFETTDLHDMSPAMAARITIIDVPAEELTWRPVVQCWLQSAVLPGLATTSGALEELLEAHLAPTLEFVEQQCSTSVVAAIRMMPPEPALAAGVCAILERLLAEAEAGDNDTDEDATSAQWKQRAERALVFALTWGIGSVLSSPESRLLFHEFLLRQLSDLECVVSDVATLPEDATVYDICVGEGVFVLWRDIVRQTLPSVNPHDPPSAWITATPDTARHDYVMRLMLDAGRGVLLVGEYGSGKASLTRHALGSLDPTVYRSAVHQCGPHSTAAHLLDRIATRTGLERERRGQLVAPAGRKIVVAALDVHVCRGEMPLPYAGAGLLDDAAAGTRSAGGVMGSGTAAGKSIGRTGPAPEYRESGGFSEPASGIAVSLISAGSGVTPAAPSHRRVPLTDSMQVLEQLRQLCDSKGFYDNESHVFKEIRGLQLVATADLDDLWRHAGPVAISAARRVMRHMHTLRVPNPTFIDAERIFKKLIGARMELPLADLGGLRSEALGAIASATASLFMEMQSKRVLPAPGNSFSAPNDDLAVYASSVPLISLHNAVRVLHGLLAMLPEHLPGLDASTDALDQQARAMSMLCKLWEHELRREMRDLLPDSPLVVGSLATGKSAASLQKEVVSLRSVFDDKFRNVVKEYRTLGVLLPHLVADEHQSSISTISQDTLTAGSSDAVPSAASVPSMDTEGIMLWTVGKDMSEEDDIYGEHEDDEENDEKREAVLWSPSETDANVAALLAQSAQRICDKQAGIMGTGAGQIPTSPEGGASLSSAMGKMGLRTPAGSNALGVGVGSGIGAYLGPGAPPGCDRDRDWAILSLVADRMKWSLPQLAFESGAVLPPNSAARLAVRRAARLLRALKRPAGHAVIVGSIQQRLAHGIDAQPAAGGASQGGDGAATLPDELTVDRDGQALSLLCAEATGAGFYTFQGAKAPYGEVAELLRAAALEAAISHKSVVVCVTSAQRLPPPSLALITEFVGHGPPADGLWDVVSRKRILQAFGSAAASRSHEIAFETAFESFAAAARRHLHIVFTYCSTNPVPNHALAGCALLQEHAILAALCAPIAYLPESPADLWERARRSLTGQMVADAREVMFRKGRDGVVPSGYGDHATETETDLDLDRENEDPSVLEKARVKAREHLSALCVEVYEIVKREAESAGNMIGQKGEKAGTSTGEGKSDVKADSLPSLFAHGQQAYNTVNPHLSPRIFALFLEQFCRLSHALRAHALHMLFACHGSVRNIDQLLENVETWQKDAVELRPRIQQLNEESQGLLATMQQERQTDESMQEAVEKTEKSLKRRRADAEKAHGSAQRSLDEAEDALNAAIDKVDALLPEDYQEVVASVDGLSAGAVRVIEALCVVLGQDEASTERAIQLMGRDDFSRHLRQFAELALEAPDEQEAMCEHVVNEFMDDDTASELMPNRGLRYLAEWMEAWIHHSEAHVQASEWTSRVLAETRKIESEEAVLQERKAKLANAAERMASLTEEYESLARTRRNMQNRCDDAALYLRRTDKVMNAVSDDLDQWKAEAARMEAVLPTLLGHALLSAASTELLGAFDPPRRTRLVQRLIRACRRWGVPVANDYSVCGTVLAEPELTQVLWHHAGLHNDREPGFARRFITTDGDESSSPEDETTATETEREGEAANIPDPRFGGFKLAGLGLGFVYRDSVQARGDEQEARRLAVHGLPGAASFSADQMASALRTTRRWPLLVDPQGQASDWLRVVDKMGNGLGGTWVEHPSSADSAPLLSLDPLAAYLEDPATLLASTERLEDVHSFVQAARLTREGKKPHVPVRAALANGAETTLPPAERTVKILRMGQPGIGTQLAMSLSQGHTVIVEGVDTEFIDPVLEPLLNRPADVHRPAQDGEAEDAVPSSPKRPRERMRVRIGGKTVRYHPDFRLFLVTTSASPKFAPELFERVAVFNFASTEPGMRSVFLDAMMHAERTWSKRAEAVSVAVLHAARIRDLRAKTVVELSSGELSSGEGSNGDGVTALGGGGTVDVDQVCDLKAQIDDLVDDMRESHGVLSRLQKSRGVYETVAARASLGFGTLLDLAPFSPVYRPFLPSFVDAMRSTFLEQIATPDLSTRISALNEAVDTNLYSLFFRGGLWATHRPIFAFSLAVRIAALHGLLAPLEWECFTAWMSSSPGSIGAASSKGGAHKAHVDAFDAWLTKRAPQEIRNHISASVLGMLTGGSDKSPVKPAATQTSGDVWPSPRMLRGLARLELSGALPPGCSMSVVSESDLADLTVRPRSPAHQTVPTQMQWIQFVSNIDPCRAALPGPLNGPGRLTAFQRMLLVCVLREDKAISAMAEFVRTQLGSRFADPPPPMDLGAVLTEQDDEHQAVQKELSRQKSQMISDDPDDLETSATSIELRAVRPMMVVSSGLAYNVESTVTAVAQSHGKRELLRLVPLWPGIEPARKAEIALKNAVQQGHWLVLQGVHLASRPFLATLARAAHGWMVLARQQGRAALGSTVDGLMKDGDERDAATSAAEGGGGRDPSVSDTELRPHPDFRLFVTAEAHCVGALPVTLIQACQVVLLEPPVGLRAQLQLVYRNSFREHRAGLMRVRKQRQLKRLLFSTCFFHSVLHERFRYAGVGFHEQPRFREDSDLRLAVDTLAQLLEEHGEIPYTIIQLLLLQATHGNSFTDPQDRAKLVCLMEPYFSAQIMSDKYQFSASGTYHPPGDGPALTDHKTYIQSLPSTDPADILGLSEIARAPIDSGDTRAHYKALGIIAGHAFTRMGMQVGQLGQVAVSQPTHVHSAASGRRSEMELDVLRASSFITTALPRMMPASSSAAVSRHLLAIGAVSAASSLLDLLPAALPALIPSHNVDVGTHAAIAVNEAPVIIDVCSPMQHYQHSERAAMNRFLAYVRGSLLAIIQAHGGVADRKVPSGPTSTEMNASMTATTLGGESVVSSTTGPANSQLELEMEAMVHGYCADLLHDPASIDDAGRCLALRRVPRGWAPLATDSRRTIAAWLRDVRERVQFLRDWPLPEITSAPAIEPAKQSSDSTAAGDGDAANIATPSPTKVHLQHLARPMGIFDSAIASYRLACVAQEQEEDDGSAETQVVHGPVRFEYVFVPDESMVDDMLHHAWASLKPATALQTHAQHAATVMIGGLVLENAQFNAQKIMLYEVPDVDTRPNTAADPAKPKSRGGLASSHGRSGLVHAGSSVNIDVDASKASLLGTSSTAAGLCAPVSMPTVICIPVESPLDPVQDDPPVFGLMRSQQASISKLSASVAAAAAAAGSTGTPASQSTSALGATGDETDTVARTMSAADGLRMREGSEDEEDEEGTDVDVRGRAGSRAIRESESDVVLRKQIRKRQKMKNDIYWCPVYRTTVHGAASRPDAPAEPSAAVPFIHAVGPNAQAHAQALIAGRSSSSMSVAANALDTPITYIPLPCRSSLSGGLPPAQWSLVGTALYMAGNE